MRVAFATRTLPEQPDVLAPDGSQVRVLLALAGGSMAHFRLPARQVSRAVRHRTVAEIWYVLEGWGQMWRRQDNRETVTPLAPGTCLTIPPGTAFQFRVDGDAALAAVAVTMPPWPGPEEAEFVEGCWLAAV
jgi:mannose-6-phosphate isomerase-like protein (cupin superfamily)